MPQKLVFATNNAHKLEEVAAILGNKVELLSLNDIGCHTDIPETADTLEGNALLKSSFIYENYHLNCFADDTGLEVEALGGAPGVYSARYAGTEGHDSQANMTKLLHEMEGRDNRRAQFRTAISLILNGEQYLFEGVIKGQIIKERRGNSGFGYDPVFQPEGYNETFAELGNDTKNAISHRALAVGKLCEFFIAKTHSLFGLLLVTLMVAASCQSPSQALSTAGSRIVANPINLNYNFQAGEDSYREAADPVCEYFNGTYYLFASKSDGYWSSPDLCTWTYILCKSITTINDYAPTVFAYEGMLYYLASGGNPQIFRTATPDKDSWEAIDTKFDYGNIDPSFFLDDDGKVYLYWGCSNENPIVGVQVDPKDGFKALSTPDTLITHQYKNYGWEAPGDNNEKDEKGWNEGACMIKYKDRYYLQYAAPGTQFRGYADGVYVSDRPLGPFTYVESNPFSFKPGGYIGGAGHGHTFKDKYGNYWHVASMKISVRHMFERRLGLFPVYISDNNRIYQHSVFTDYPYSIPDGRRDVEKDNLSLGWNLLSYRKEVSASSSLPGYEAALANDEQVETWWTSATGTPGEWWQIDLGDRVTINALQVNFADQDFKLTDSSIPFPLYRYKVEASDDGRKWKLIVDRTNNTKDAPHELIILDNANRARFLRITNARQLDAKFSLSDFRVFGKGNGDLPPVVTDMTIDRNKADGRMISFHWTKRANTTGYILRWGVEEGRLNSALMVFDNEPIYRFFNRASAYYFTIDSFNENGITRGDKVYKVD